MIEFCLQSEAFGALFKRCAFGPVSARKNKFSLTELEMNKRGFTKIEVFHYSKTRIFALTEQTYDMDRDASKKNLTRK